MNDSHSLTDYQSVRQLAIRSLFEIIEQFSEGTLIVDREARIVWINQRYAQRFGLADPEQTVGRPVESVIPGSLMREVVRSGRPMLLDILDLARDPLVVMRMPIRDDSGAVIGAANAAGIPLEVLHRVAAMASGGMDTLPHNGAVITLLAVTGLTHREAYKDIFAITLIKTLAVFVVITLFYTTGIV
ncbi:PAS domain-containing protein [Pseudomonas panipatensis]|uniref:PAS fold-containing protein n=1 Tax=Pseudomonas panipatensis TaxID=428992 RepID=A0A1G8ILK2_9PSED|nr:PAS fold-containing protein [Pseudomonas panipatensis]SMP73520.1 PAS fold-containing protein [Pseudomonas panipatensis]